MIKCIRSLWVLFMLCSAIVVPAVATAEEQPGITLAPARLQITLQKGQQMQSATIMVKNSYNQRVSFMATVRAVQQGTDGSLVPDVGQGGSPFKDTIVVTPAAFALDAGQSVNLRLDLVDSSQLPPGGQYAALLVSQVSENAGNVRLTPAVAAGLFIVKEEGAMRKLVASISGHNGSLLQPLSQVDVLFRNEGNVPLTPRAVVRLADTTGRVVAQGVSNEESLTVMPGKDVKVRTTLQSLGGASWRPGNYRLSVQYRSEGADETTELTQRQLVLPPQLLVTVSGGVVLGAVAIGLLRAMYKRSRRKRRVIHGPSPVVGGVGQSLPSGAHAVAPSNQRTTDGITRRASAPAQKSAAQRVDKHV